MWLRHHGNVEGTNVGGDPTAPPTRWWNHLYLALIGWKMVSIFEVSPATATLGYRVGFLPQNGKAMVKQEVCHDEKFAMKNGHEECTFFVIDTNDGVVAPRIVLRTTVSEARHMRIPIH